MSSAKTLIIEPLNTSHDRAAFSCGNSELDNYFRKIAGQDLKRRMAQVFVARTPQNPAIVLGYYTLSALSIDPGNLPHPVARKLPRIPIPAALIGRLAVSQAAQGQSIGSRMLADAVKRTLAISDEIAVYALVVDAIDESASLFYQKFGFLTTCPRETVSAFDKQRLFLPLKSVILSKP